MLFERHSIIDWAKWDQNDFEKAYSASDFSTLRNYLEQRMRNDSIRILRRLSLRDHAFLQVRQKHATSVLNKLIKMAKAVTAGKEIVLLRRQKELIDVSKQYFLYELVKDIIGLRYICIDHPTLESLLGHLLRSEVHKVKDFEIYRPFFHEYDPNADIAPTLFATLMSETPQIISKASYYESIHLEISFGAPRDRYPVRGLSTDRSAARGFASTEPDGEDWLSRQLFEYRMEIQEQLDQKMNTETKALISSFPIEVQIRTFTQHIWAQDEHKFVYSPTKTGAAIDDVTLDRTRGAFTALKFFLNSSESIRHLIRAMQAGNLQNQEVLEAQGIEVASRLHFFEEPKFAQVRVRLLALDRDTSENTRRRRLGIGGDPLFWETAVKTLHDIVEEASQIEPHYLKSNHRGELAYWGRQRIVAMILGYILLFCVEEPADSSSPIRGIRDFRDRLRQFLLERGFGALLGVLGSMSESEYLVANYTANLAIRVYEYVKLNDRYFLDYDPQKEAIEHLFDALIFTRYATAHYRIGEFAPAYRVLSEFFDSVHYRKEYWNGRIHKGHSEIELRSRLLQYMWYRHALDQDQIANSFSIYESLFQNLHRTILADMQENFNDALKASCWFLWIHGSLRALRGPISRTLENLSEELDTIFKNSFSEIPKELEDKVYFHAARALSLIKQRNINDAQAALGTARDLLRAGVPHPSFAVNIQSSMLEVLHSELIGSKYHWELFVSYSREDSATVRELVLNLKEKGIRVFFDEDNIQVGDSITPKIEAGLLHSNHILMFVTQSYLDKRKWTDLERIWFESQEEWIGERKFIVVLNGVSLKEFQSRYPTLADRLVLVLGSKETSNIDAAVPAILKAIKTDSQRK